MAASRPLNLQLGTITTGESPSGGRNTYRVNFNPAFNDNPNMTMALTFLDIERDGDVWLSCGKNAVFTCGAVVNLGTWNTSKRHVVKAGWFATDARDTRVQAGMLFPSNHGQISGIVVRFSTPFPKPPTVLVFLTHLGLKWDERPKVVLEAKYVTKASFAVTLSPWLGTTGLAAGAGWIDFDPEATNIIAGAVETEHSISGKADRRSGYVEFPQGHFTETPRVFLGLSGIDFGQDSNVHIETKCTEVSIRGFRWLAISWPTCRYLKVRMSYFAVPAAQSYEEDWVEV